MTATRTTLLLLALAAPSALAQQAIYSNGSADPSVLPLSTGTLTGSGIAAPPGGSWSELQGSSTECNATGGVAAHVAPNGGAFRLADDFIISINPGWRLDTISFFAYQSGASSCPVAALNLQIWNGRPGDAGSTIVFGDTTTNRLVQTAATGIYRTFNTTVAPPTAPDTTKQVWQLDADTARLFLPPGHYWLDWQYITATTGAEAFSPTVTLIGARTQTGWNARQFDTTLAWSDLGDRGKPNTAADLPQDIPFVIRGFAGTQPCSADFNGDGDAGTDADIEAFFACLAGDCCATCGSADFNGDGDVGTDADIESFFRVLAGNPC